MRYCHDKRLRNSPSLARLFSTIFVVVFFSSLFGSKWPFFVFLRNVHSSIEILKIKILEHSDPPSQHFSVHKAFSPFISQRRRVVLCHLAEWHIVFVFVHTRKRDVVFLVLIMEFLETLCSFYYLISFHVDIITNCSYISTVY